jgi:DNA-binding MarR family transcriptional regulator
MDPHRNEIRRLMIAVNVIDGIYETIAKRAGIKLNALTLLYALDDGRPHSQKEICEEWFIPPTTLNTIVRENIAAGRLTLAADPGKKEKEIRLTEEGAAFARAILNQVYELEQTAMERTLSAVSPEFVPALELFTAHLKDEARSFPHGPERAV